MSEITELKLWKDPGFTDGCVEVPAFANVDVLPEADLTLDDGLNPSKGRMFSEIKLNRSFSDVQDMSYLKMSVSYNNGTDRVYYAFIDSVSIVSDTEDFPAVNINFHVDLWRTYLTGAEFGFGTVTRRARGVNDPIQNLTSRYKKVSEHVFELIPDDLVGGSCFWAIVNYTYEDTNTHNAEIRTIVCPVAKTTDTVYYFKLSAEGTKYRVPTLNQWILGDFDEIFGIPPSAIASAYLSPIPPLKMYSGTGTSDDPFIVVGQSVSPEPHVRTGSLVTLDKYINGCRHTSTGTTVPRDTMHVKYNDGTEQATPNLSTYGVRGGFTKRENGGSVFVDLYQNNTLIRTAPENEMIYTASIDDYMRAVLGETVFENLANGDTITFTNHNGIYSGASFEWVGNEYYATTVVRFKMNVGPDMAGTTVFTYNNGTFGNYYIVSYGFPTAVNYTLTTYSEGTTTADYGVVPVSYSGENYAYLYTKTNRFYEYSAELPDVITTTDTETLVFTDLDGSLLATLPWGIPLKEYSFRCVIASASAYVQFRFDGLNSAIEGVQLTAPLPSLDLTSNSWSDYVYSGQREFDITQRKINNQQQLVNGLSGALTSGAQGAMFGALKGNATIEPYTYGGKAWREIGGMAGLGALGAVSSLAGSAINYATTEYFNDRIQGAVDVLQAKQIDALTIAGSGMDWLYYGRQYQIRTIVPDDYSLERFVNNISLNGVSVSEPTADCTELIHGTGPLAIENLIVRGDIPAEAKQYIKAKLNNGVRLI